MRGKTIAIFGSLLLAGATLTSCSAYGQIATPVAVYGTATTHAELPFDFFRESRVFVRGKLNGQVTDMMLDTGASITTLDRNYAAAIGLKGGQKIQAQGAGGSVEGEVFHNVSAELGPLKLSGMTILVLDLAPVARTLGRPLPVVLGREFFMSSVVAIDFERRRLTVYDPKRFVAPAGASAIRLGRDGLMHTMQVSLAGLPPVTADLDLGNGGTLIASRKYWRENDTLGQLRFAVSESGGVGGLLPTRRVVLPSVDFGGQRFSAVPAEMSDHPKALPDKGINVGIGLLRPFDVTLDLGRDRLFLKRNAWSERWPKDRAGLRTDLVGDRLQVAHVSPGSPADLSGIKKGDSFVAVNGVPVSADYYKAGMYRWTRGATGSVATLTHPDGRTVKLTLADYF